MTYKLDSPDYTFERTIPAASRTQAIDDAALAIANAYKAFCDLIGYVPYTVSVDVVTDTGASDTSNLLYFDGEGTTG